MFLVWLVFVVATAVVAEQKKRSALGWFFLALLSGPIAFIIILIIPKKQTPPYATIFSDFNGVSKESLKFEFVELQRQMSELGNRVSNLGAKIDALQQETAKPAAAAQPQPAPQPQPAEPAPAPQPTQLPEPALAMHPAQGPSAIVLDETLTGRSKNRKGDLEADLGKYWLNKIGIIIFSLGVAFLLTYTFAHFGPVAKILFGYVVAAGLFITGIKLERSERFINYGRVLLGGAWAITYFTSFAMYHFPAAKIIDNQLLDLLLLAAVAAGIILHSLRYKSEALTAVALFVGFVTCVLGDVSYFSLVSAAMLALAALILVWRMQWIRFVFLGIVLTYLVHFAWVIKQITLSMVPASGLTVGNILFHFDAGFLVIYWTLFTAAAHVLRSQTHDPAYRKLAAANFANFLLFFLMLYPKLQYFYPDQRFTVVLGFGLAYLVLGLVCELSRKNSIFISDIIIAVSLLTFSVPLKFMPYHTSVIWFVELPFLLLVGMLFKRRVYRYLGFAVSIILFVKFLLGDWRLFDDVLWLGSVRTSWQAFLALIGFISTASCYALYRFMNKEEAGRETVLQHFYSAFAVAYVSIYLWEIVRPLWMTLGFSLVSLAVFVAGVVLLDRFVRWYGLVLMALAAVRFLFDRYDAANELQQLVLTYGPIACALAEYVVYRMLKRRSLIDEPEARLSKILFFGAASLLVFAVVVYVQPVWITLSIALIGLAALVWGAASAEPSIRVYSLLVLGLAALRFAFIDSYAQLSALSQWLLIIVKLAFAYAAYFVYRGLRKNNRLSEAEIPLVSFIFYAAALLTVVAVFKYVQNIWVSISLGVVGVDLFCVGFMVKEKVFRHGGFIIFGLTLLRVAFVDLAGLPIIYKIISFIVVGVLFLGVSFAYTKYMIDKK